MLRRSRGVEGKLKGCSRGILRYSRVVHGMSEGFSRDFQGGLPVSADRRDVKQSLVVAAQADIESKV
jgi:hypothetical protein